MNEGLSFAQDVSPENSVGSFLCFWLALVHLVASFSYIRHDLCLLHIFLLLFHLKLMWFIYLLMYLSLETFMSIISKVCLTYFDGTDRPIELCYNFPISKDLIQRFNFPIWIPDCSTKSSALLDLFPLTLVFKGF